MSIAVLKRKTLNGNPRLAPVSGSNNGKFGFSLNGTRRNVGGVGITNLAPGAMTGPTQMIASTIAHPTSFGIYGHPSSVCTNDPTVVKTTVINTRGMLSRRANGLPRIPPMAPTRADMGGCGAGGQIIAEAEPYKECSSKFCPPIWVKSPLIPNGNQSEYIKRFVHVRGNTTGKFCNSTKSYNGIVGIVDKNETTFPISKCKRPKCNISKPGILTINYSEYLSRRILINNCLPATDLDAPIPNPMVNRDANCRESNPFNVNIPPQL